MEKIYAKYVNEIQNQLGSDSTTTTTQLNNLGSKLFGSHYLGSFPADIFTKQIRNKMKHGDIAIVNTDDNSGKGKHWLLAVKDKEDLLMYDSYGQNIKTYNPNFKNLKIVQDQKDAEQKFLPEERNCGQRSLANALVYQKLGRGNFLKV